MVLTGADIGGTGPAVTVAVTDDEFLGGRLRLLQPETGYRIGGDSVLLAATVPARPGETVLDVGCGSGAIEATSGRGRTGLASAGCTVSGDCSLRLAATSRDADCMEPSICPRVAIHTGTPISAVITM